MKTQITKPDHLELPKPLPTRTVGDDPINQLLDKIAIVVLVVLCSFIVAFWAACWFRIYAYIWSFINANI